MEAKGMRAMAEVVYTASLSEEQLKALSKAVDFAKEARLVAERQPDSIIKNDKERNDLLYFNYWSESQEVDLLAYTSGRIFGANGELRWERQGEKLRVIYVGDSKQEGILRDFGFQRRDEGLVEPDDPRYYYLFGERIKAVDLPKIGQRAQEGDFANARIPRILRYPVENNEQTHVRLGVREFYDAGTGEVMLTRFYSLEAITPVVEPEGDEE